MDPSILTALYENIDPWVFWPAVGAVLVLTNWAAISEIWADLSPARRHARHQKDALELELLRHEIAALRKSNNLLQADIEAVDGRAGLRMGTGTIRLHHYASARTYAEAVSGGLFGAFAAVMADLMIKGGASAAFAAQGLTHDLVGLDLPALGFFLFYIALGGLFGLVFHGKRPSFLRSVLVGAAAVAILFSLVPVDLPAAAVSPAGPAAPL